jgi:hypothetical protein
MSRTELGLLALLFSLIPYTAVSWGWVVYTNGGGREFATAFGVLLVARLFFATIETLGGIVAWRAYGRQVMLRRLLTSFRSPKVAPDRLADEDNPPTFDQLPVTLQVEILRWVGESSGFLAEMRFESVITEAAQIYGPSAKV